MPPRTLAVGDFVTTTDLLRAARGFAAQHQRLLAVALVVVLVIIGSITAVNVAAKASADELARTQAVAALALEHQRVHNYRSALADLQPAGAQLVDDATAWAGSGSSLLTAADILALQSTADAVGGSLSRIPAADATSAQLEKLFDSQSRMINGARQRLAYVISTVSAAAKAHLDAAPIADAATRQSLIDALAALAAAAKDHSSVASPLTTVTATVAAVDAAQAAAVAAQAAAAAAAARHSGGRTPVVRADGTPEPTCSSTVLACSNQLRAFYGKGTLASNGSLNTAAQACAQRMSDAQAMTHTTGGAANIPPGMHTWGENIAYGYGSQSSVFTGWQHSKGHHDNIINGAFTQMGLGSVTDTHGTIWWCQQFAG